MAAAAAAAAATEDVLLARRRSPSLAGLCAGPAAGVCGAGPDLRAAAGRGAAGGRAGRGGDLRAARRAGGGRQLRPPARARVQPRLHVRKRRSRCAAVPSRTPVSQTVAHLVSAAAKPELPLYNRTSLPLHAADMPTRSPASPVHCTSRDRMCPWASPRHVFHLRPVAGVWGAATRGARCARSASTGAALGTSTASTWRATCSKPSAAPKSGWRSGTASPGTSSTSAPCRTSTSRHAPALL